MFHRSLNSSSDSITGKRVRKKNPKYLDEEIPTEDNINNNNGVSKKSGGSRPKKKRKISHQPSVVQDIVVSSSTTTITTSVESFASLSKKKVDLHNQIKKIADELVELEKQLISKHEEQGLPYTPSNIDHIVNYNVAEPMDISPTTKKPKTTRKKSTRARGNGVKRTTPRKSTKKKATTTTPTPPKVPVVRPKRVRLPKNDVQLLPEFMFCRQVLDALMTHSFGFVFNEPVDPVALQIPDYPLIITRPMDFGTIRKKLNSSEYRNPEEFIDDVNLVFDNACTYNLPGSDVFLMTETVRKLFKEKIKVLEKKEGSSLREEMRQIMEKSKVTTPSPVVAAKPKPKPKPVTTAPTPPITRKITKPEEILIPLTKDEKRRLSSGINSLAPSHLAVVVKIIKEKLPNLTSEKNEIVIDIDSLDTATLRSLESFVQSTKKKPKRKPPAKRRTSSALHVDPAARLELAKLTEIGMQNKIESVERELQLLNSSGNGLHSSTSNLSESIKSLDSSTGQKENENSLSIDQPKKEDDSNNINPSEELKDSAQTDDSEEDSESESEESESESEESDSETERPVYGSNNVKNTLVETVVAPVLSNLPDIPAPRIISTTPGNSEVKAGKIENVASWADLGSTSDEVEPTTVSQSSEGAANLWSSIRDSHAQLKQKEHEKILHEERLKREKEEQEAARLKAIEEARIKQQEEEERRKEEEMREREEAKKRAEREIEEARLKAKRDREKKVEDDEEADLLSLDSFPSLAGPGLLGMNISGKVMSDIRSSLKATTTIDQTSSNTE